MFGDISYWHTTRNNWLKPIFLAGENTSVLIILATAVVLSLKHFYKSDFTVYL